MKEFVTAAEREPAYDESRVTTFIHDGREVTFYEPTPSQYSLLQTLAVGERDDARAVRTFLAMFMELADDDTQRYFEGRLLSRTDTFDLDGEGGVFEIWQYLSEEWSARPTKQPSDYQSSRSRTGRSSTATSRAKASTSSRSPSRATSQ